MNLVEVCSEDYVDEKTLKPVDVEGIQLMVVRIEKEIKVLSRICTHKTYDLTKGHYADGYVTCLLHTSIFDLEDGEAQNPPASEPLQVYSTVIKDGKVYIDIDD